MSNTIFVIIVAVVVAIGLDWWLVRWWKQRRQVKNGTVDQSETSRETPLMKSPRSLSNFLNVGSSRVAVIALSLGLLAQFWLTAGTALLGGILYFFAIVLFVRSVHTVAPSKFDPPILSASESEPKTLLKPANIIGVAKPKTYSKVDTTVQSPSFWKHWRYYTIGNLIKGTPPNIPAPVLAPPTPLEQTSSEIQTTPIPVNIFGETVIETLFEIPTQSPVRAPIVEASTQPVFSLTIAPQPPTVVSSPVDTSTEVVKSTPTPITPSPITPLVSTIGTHHSRVMTVTPTGDVMVIDSTKQLLFVFDPQGQLHKQQSFDALPNLTADDITFSPDGTTAYIFDSGDSIAEGDFTLMIASLMTDLEIRGGRFRLFGLSLIGLSILAGLLALATFPTNAPSAWGPYLVSPILFAAGGYFLFPARSRQPGPPPLSRWTLISLVAILGIAIFMRFYQLNQIPFGTWRDEANISHAAERILADPTYRPIFVADNVHPMHLYALVAFAFRIFGISTTTIRAVTATFGVVSVLVAFLLGREIYGNRFGLICAFLLAVLRWHITFSRFGIPSITAPFFELLSLWLLFRARRTQRLTDFIWAGLAFGLGLNFYAAFRLFALVVLAFLILISLQQRFVTSSGTSKPVVLIANLSAFAIATTLVIAPLVQFALFTDPDIFWTNSRDTSVFFMHDAPDVSTAILSNTLKHLLMFNYQGDKNGRHNLPQIPMLDPVMGVFFILGLALAASRPRSTFHFVFLIVLLASLAGGIFSVDFEAPQANRSIGAIVAVIYFAALAIETLWRKFELDLAPSLRTSLTIVTLGASGLIFYLNASTYFGLQANSNDVWEAFNGIQSLAAQKMLAAGGPEEVTYYASVFLNNHETIRFLAPEIETKPLIPPNGLPIHEPGDKAVIIMVDLDNQWIIDQAHLFYPQAEYHTEQTPVGNPAFSWILIPPEQIQAVQGLTAQYWVGSTESGAAPAFTRIESTITTDWPAGAPLAQPFGAQWKGILYAPTSGIYQFILKTPATATLTIDNNQVGSGQGEQTLEANLAIGNHTILLTANSGSGAVKLAWRPPDDVNHKFELANIQSQWLYQSPPAQPNGLLGAYYQNDNWTGEPAFTRIDPYLDTYYHIIPLQRPYSIDWRGTIQIPNTGDYAFGLWLNGHAQVFIDNQLVVDAPQPTQYLENTINLATGPHKIQIKYLDTENASRIHLYWTPPGQEKQIIPTSALMPYP